jgi:hypothetical protein
MVGLAMGGQSSVHGLRQHSFWRQVSAAARKGYPPALCPKVHRRSTTVDIVDRRYVNLRQPADLSYDELFFPAFHQSRSVDLAPNLPAFFSYLPTCVLSFFDVSSQLVRYDMRLRSSALCSFLNPSYGQLRPPMLVLGISLNCRSLSELPLVPR